MRKMICLLALAGCSNAATALDLAAGDLSATGELGSTDNRDLGISPIYPAGPYGHAVGDTLPPLVWEGYADPLADAIATSKMYGSFSMNDLRLSGRAYAAVHVSQFY
jgi:hypothetical protein